MIKGSRERVVLVGLTVELISDRVFSQLQILSNLDFFHVIYTFVHNGKY